MDDQEELIQVSVGGYLTFFTPGKQKDFLINVTPGMVVTDVLLFLNIPVAEAALVVLNDDVIEDLSTVLQADDKVKVFSASDGG